MRRWAFPLPAEDPVRGTNELLRDDGGPLNEVGPARERSRVRLDTWLIRLLSVCSLIRARLWFRSQLGPRAFKRLCRNQPAVLQLSAEHDHSILLLLALRNRSSQLLL